MGFVLNDFNKGDDFERLKSATKNYNLILKIRFNWIVDECTMIIKEWSL